jgi:hypothetical protein
VKTYIKIYGSPIGKALETLKVIADEAPEGLIKHYYTIFSPPVEVPPTSVEVPVTSKGKLISRYGHMLGDTDFFFEWARDPTDKGVFDLISKVYEAFDSLGCNYTSVTK